MGPKTYPKASKCTRNSTQRRQDGTKSNQMEPKECPKRSKCVKRASKVSKVEPKATHMEPNGQPAAKMEPKVDQVLEFHECGIDFRSYSGALWEQIPSIISPKIHAKINAEKVMNIDEKSMRKRSRISSEIGLKIERLRKVPHAK